MAGLSALWSARSIAIIGASTRPGSPGRLPVEFLLRYGYTGRIVPVNPRAEEICGLRAYPSLTVAGPVDLALIMVGADLAALAIAECAQLGVPVAIVGASGFAEAGERTLQEALLVRRGQTRILGPNCIGAANFHTGLIANFSPLFSGEDTKLNPGGIALVSQSGALGFGIVSLAQDRGLGLGWAVTTGNEADVTALELLTELAREPECEGLLGYVETLSDGPALRRLAAEGKPTALLVAGRSVAGQRAAASHTGALAGNDRVTDAALRQYGIVRVADIDELLDIGMAFAAKRTLGTTQNLLSLSLSLSLPVSPTPRVAVVTTSGGSGILTADALAEQGLELAVLAAETRIALEEIVPAFGSTANPIDVTATVMSDPSLVARCLAAVDSDSGVDAIVLCFCVLTGDDVTGIVEALATVGKPVVVSRTGAEHLAPAAADALRALGVPCYPTPARAVRALAAMGVRPAASTEAATGTASVARTASPPRDEVELKAALSAVGISVPHGHFMTSAEEFGFSGRAVLKAVVPGLIHKTEAGAVILGVTSESAAEAFEHLAALGGRVWAEEQVDDGVELLVSVSPSPLGRILTIGAGGVWTELLDDVAIRLLPTTDIPSMLDELRLAPILRGYRGRPAVDVAALVDLVTKLLDLTSTWPQDLAIELNPVAVRAKGAVVLDAVCERVSERAEGGV